jgi:hypothetical protein
LHSVAEIIEKTALSGTCASNPPHDFPLPKATWFAVIRSRRLRLLDWVIDAGFRLLNVFPSNEQHFLTFAEQFDLHDKYSVARKFWCFIGGEADYFSDQTKLADRVMSRARVVIRCSIGFSIGGNLFVMSSKIFPSFPSGPWTSLLGLAVALALQIAAGIGAMIVINDYARRQQRYLEMRRLILNYGKQLEQAQTWPSLFRHQKFGK